MTNNTIELKEHNLEIYEIIKKAYSERNHIGVVQATGTGKSYLIANTINDMKFKNVLFLTSSLHIIKEFKKEFPFLLNRIEFMTYKKLAHIKDFNTFLKNSNYDFIVLDEYHRCGAKTWYKPIKRVLKFYKNTKVLGVTATPIRYLDNNKDMTKELFDSEPISEISLLEAIKNKILPKPKYVLSYYNIENDIEKLKLKKIKDINDDGTIKNFNYIINNINLLSNIENILSKNINDERKFIVFCTNINHLKEMSKIVPKWFHKIGFKTETYNVYRSTKEFKTNKMIEEELENFKNAKKDDDKIVLLFSIDLLNEGVHIDDVDGVILFRKTISPIIFFQQIGRTLKTGNKSPLIFDLVNNIKGFSFEERNLHLNKSSIERTFVESFKNYTLDSNIDVIDYTESVDKLLVSIDELSSKTTWKYFIEGLVKYKEEHGDCNVPSTHPLYRKCTRIRQEYKNGILNEYKFKELDDLGFKWDASIYNDELWESMFEKLLEFKSKFNHTNVPRSYDDKKLATWVHTQRKFRDNMPEDRKEKLLSIGFKFEIAKTKNQKEWDNMFLELLKFKEKFGHVKVSSRYEDKKLSNWVNTQRKAYKAGKLDEYRYNKLVEVNFEF